MVGAVDDVQLPLLLLPDPNPATGWSARLTTYSYLCCDGPLGTIAFVRMRQFTHY